MDQGDHCAVSDSLQENLHCAVCGVTCIFPCKSYLLVGDNVKEFSFISVLIAVSPAHSELYLRTFSEPCIELTRLSKGGEDSARRGRGSNFLDDGPAAE